MNTIESQYFQEKYPALTGLLESVKCPICQKEDYDVLQEAKYPSDTSKNDFLNAYSSSSDHILMDRLVQCKTCSLVYLNPRVDSSIILESYSKAVDSKFIEQNPDRIKTFKRNFANILEKYPVKQQARVLDIGCAGGAFPEAVHQLGCDVIGIEPSQWLCEQGRKMYGLDLRSGVLKDQSFENSFFDYITLWDVIEHLTDPSQELAEIRRVLKDEGYFIVNYPDYGSLARRLLNEKWPFYLSVHLYYFTPSTITQYLNQNGFDVVSVKPYWQTLPLGYVLERAEKYFKMFSVFSKITDALSLSKLSLTYNVGQTLVVARKKR